MKRFTLLDSLRGVAALSVLFCHLSIFGLKAYAAEHEVLKLVCGLLDHGRLGVQIFFVISGFVITHSLRDLPIAGRAIWMFIVRRQARLDPAYWTMLALTTAVLSLGLLGAEARDLFHQQFSLGGLIANMLYVHRFFNLPTIVGVAWTLCFEVQFYLLFVLLLVVGHYLAPHLRQAEPRTVTYWLVCGTGLLSVLAACVTPGRAANQVTGLQCWYFFAAGSLAYWAGQGKEAQSGFYLLLAGQGLALVLKVVGVAYGDTPALIVGAGTASLLYVTGRRNTLEKWGDSRLLLYFGGVSYSLYLAHSLVIKGVFHWGQGWLASSPWMLLAGSIASLALCVGVTALFYSLVELPSLRLSQQLKKWGKDGKLALVPVRRGESEAGAV